MSRIDHMRNQVQKKPQDLKVRLELLSHLIGEGLESDLRRDLSEALNTIHKSPLLPERFHKPLIKTLKEFWMWRPMEMVCRDLERHYGEDIDEDESLKRMLRRARKAILEGCPHPMLPPNLKGELWWREPRMAPVVHPKNKTPIEGWCPCYLEEGIEGRYYMHMMAHDDDDYLEVLTLDLDHDTFEEDLGGGTIDVNKRVEMAYYANEETLYFFED